MLLISFWLKKAGYYFDPYSFCAQVPACLYCSGRGKKEFIALFVWVEILFFIGIDAFES
jgi:hypothetical protein